MSGAQDRLQQWGAQASVIRARWVPLGVISGTASPTLLCSPLYLQGRGWRLRGEASVGSHSQPGSLRLAHDRLRSHAEPGLSLLEGQEPQCGLGSCTRSQALADDCEIAVSERRGQGTITPRPLPPQVPTSAGGARKLGEAGQRPVGGSIMGRGTLFSYSFYFPNFLKKLKLRGVEMLAQVAQCVCVLCVRACVCVHMCCVRMHVCTCMCACACCVHAHVCVVCAHMSVHVCACTCAFMLYVRAHVCACVCARALCVRVESGSRSLHLHGPGCGSSISLALAWTAPPRRRPWGPAGRAGRKRHPPHGCVWGPPPGSALGGEHHRKGLFAKITGENCVRGTTEAAGAALGYRVPVCSPPFPPPEATLPRFTLGLAREGPGGSCGRASSWLPRGGVPWELRALNHRKF